MSSFLGSFWQRFREGRRDDAARSRENARDIREGMGPIPGGMAGRMNPPAVYRYFERKIKSSD